MIKGYTLSTHQSDMDFSTIHEFLKSSYWAKGIPQDTLQTALDNSLCFGVFTQEGLQVGFARVVTDYATFGYLSDVFVVPSHRGKGLCQWLLQAVFEHPQLQNFRRFMLATADAHGLYSRFGFKPLAQPDWFMENWVPDIYQRG